MVIMMTLCWGPAPADPGYSKERRPPTSLLCPWDTPGKNTGVGCHFLLQCMKVKSESKVAQSCPTLSVSLLSPSINLSLLQTLTFQFV